jgi:antitoxin (DNA-binding transcriptional repressor) of toxin-antitoxin stability system
LAEWLFEAGIGEDRAALIEDGDIVEILIDRHDGRPKAGAVLAAKLVTRLPGAERSVFALLDHDGAEAVGPVPSGISEGGRLLVTVVREAIQEPGNRKAPLVRQAEPGQAVSVASSLLQRITETGTPVAELLPHQPDRLEAAGWTEQLGEAESGLIPFAGGLLRLSLTPAMSLFDVDGSLPPGDLSVAGAAAAALAIRRFDIGGSIGVDLPLPNEAGKALRNRAADEIDHLLPQPFERTAVNGFGFVQIVRRRIRPSLPELLQSDPVTAVALALLRRAERAQGRGALTLVGAPAVIQRIGEESGWLDTLARRRGTAIRLSERPGAAISAGDVQTDHA